MEDKIEVGKIEEYPVLYIPSRNLCFCKNTIVRVRDVEDVLASNLSRQRIERSNLPVSKDDNIITFGCLTTSIDNLHNIKKEILKHEQKQ